MRHLARLLAAVAVLLVPLLAFAQAASDPAAPIAYGDALTELVQLAQTAKGGGALAIAVAVVQGGMLLLRTPLASKLGKWQLTAVLGLSCVASLFAAKAAGATWLAALLSGPMLAAAQVFAHQLFAQFTEKPEPALAAVPGPVTKA